MLCSLPTSPQESALKWFCSESAWLYIYMSIITEIVSIVCECVSNLKGCAHSVSGPNLNIEVFINTSVAGF